MKFQGFREFTQSGIDTVDKVLRYLKVEMSANWKDLSNILTSIDFTHNFKTFEVDISVPASSEIAIPNELKSIPRYRIIVRGNLASKDLVDGDTAWTTEYVTLKNTSATDTATATVIFFK